MLRKQVQSTTIFVVRLDCSLKGTEYRNIKSFDITVLCTFGTEFNEHSTNIVVLCTFAKHKLI